MKHLRKTNCRLSFNAYSAYGRNRIPLEVARSGIWRQHDCVHFPGCGTRDYPFWCSQRDRICCMMVVQEASSYVVSYLQEQNVSEIDYLIFIPLR